MSNSVSAALKLIKIVSNNPCCGLSELARLADMNKSRVFRLLKDLEKEGFVAQNFTDKTYILGFSVLYLGQAARKQVDLIKLVETEIKQVSKKYDENIQIRMLEVDEVVQIYARTSNQILQVTSKVGSRRKLGLGASGKLLLAYAPMELQLQLLPNLNIDLNYLDEVRQQGYAKSIAELSDGVAAFSVPIFNNSGGCNFCLSISIPICRLEDYDQKVLVKDLQQASFNISKNMGFL